MKSKAKEQSKFMQIILSPISRILIMARDFYVKRMNDCVVGVNGAVVCQMSNVPKNFTVSNSRAINDEKLTELLRQISAKRSISGVAGLNLHRRTEVRQSASVGNNTVGRSYSVGVGKIGTIDEEKPCYFEEDLLFPRSKSHAIRNFVR